MKKSLLIIAFGALLFAGCAKEQPVAPANQETVAVSFTATLADGAATRASFDGDGAGIYADICKLQVWWGGKLFCEKTAPISDLKAKFNDIVLIKDQTYDFLFWADNSAGSYYETTDLRSVKLAGTYVGCNDRRDAFSAAIVDKKVTTSFIEQNVELKRPFAQLNVIATDIPILCKQIADDALFAACVPEKFSLKVTAPTVFNVKTGDVSVPKELTYTASVYTSPLKTAEGVYNTLSMDYFLASVNGDVVEVKFSAGNTASGLADIDYTFSNIPLRRNYRTNILCALVTVTGSISVEIKPAWTGETNVNAFVE